MKFSNCCVSVTVGSFGARLNAPPGSAVAIPYSTLPFPSVIFVEFSEWGLWLQTLRASWTMILTGRGWRRGGVLSSFYSDVLFFEGGRGTVPRPHYLTWIVSILRQGKMFCVLNWLVGFNDRQWDSGDLRWMHREKNRVFTFGPFVGSTF